MKPPRVGVATPRTYELIGRISAASADLEFVLVFCAKLADLNGEINVENSLASRTEVIKVTKKAFKTLNESGKIDGLPNIGRYIRKFNKLLSKRDALVHGYLMHKEDQGLKMYQPKKKKWVDIDDASLEKLLEDFQSLSDEVLMLRKLVWEQLHPDGLIQLGLSVRANQGEGSKLD
jgi:hypothetical protein